MLLVASDDEKVNDLLDRLLEARGYRVVTASRVEDALARASEQLPRAVVIDLSSKGMGSSMQLLDGIRQHGDGRVRNTRTVLVATSAKNRNYAFQSGTDGFLMRPFHIDELATLIAEVLAIEPTDRAKHRRRMLDLEPR